MLRVARRLATATAVCLLAAAPCGRVWAQGVEPNPRPVRSTTRWGSDVIAEGCKKSPSFRALVERLKRQRLIVYVLPAHQLPGVAVGVTELLGVNADFRYLRVSIDVRKPRKNQVALLGHELQHAVEISEAPEVVDAASLALFYSRMGDQSVDGYDSPAARAIGNLVLDELWRWRAEPAEGGPDAGARAASPTGQRPVNAELTRQ